MSLLLAHHSPWLDVLKRAEASKESIDVLREVIVLQKEIEALPPPSGRTIQEEVDSLSSRSDSYWDEFDHNCQELDDIDKDCECKLALADLKYECQQVVLERLHRKHDFSIDPASAVYDLDEVTKEVDEMFKEHLTAVLCGEPDATTRAIQIQMNWVPTFGARTKAILRFKYISIGYNPKVWIPNL